MAKKTPEKQSTTPARRAREQKPAATPSARKSTTTPAEPVRRPTETPPKAKPQATAMTATPQQPGRKLTTTPHSRQTQSISPVSLPSSLLRCLTKFSAKASSSSSPSTPHSAETQTSKPRYASRWSAQKKGGMRKGRSIKSSYQLLRQRTPSTEALDGGDNVADTSPTSTPGYSAEVKSLCGSDIDRRFPPECRAAVLAGRKCPSCGEEGKMKWQLCYKTGMEGAIAIFVSES